MGQSSSSPHRHRTATTLPLNKDMVRRSFVASKKALSFSPSVRPSVGDSSSILPETCRKSVRFEICESGSENRDTSDDVSIADDLQDHDGCETYYDCAEEDARFPLTMSTAHKFIDAIEFSRQVAEDQVRARELWANSYSEPPAALFQVRGPEYLKQPGKNTKGLKVPSRETPYEVVGVNMFHCTRRITHVSQEVGEIKRFMESHRSPLNDNGSLPTFLVINWIMSPLFGTECWVVNHVFRLRAKDRADPALEAAFKRFSQGSDGQKNKQFKYMCRIVDAPGPLTSAISALGGERPVIIGKSLTTTYHQGSDYLEVNMDISSSRIASAINKILLNNMQSAVCDCGWLLEGQKEEELPERMLAAIRWNWNRVDDIVVNLDTAGERL